MEKPTLESLFVNKQDELRGALESLSLPKDIEKIQLTISSFLSSLLDEQGEYRQNLTQSEDYMLQAVLSILHVQESVFTSLPKNVSSSSVSSAFASASAVSSSSVSGSSTSAVNKIKSVDPTVSTVAAGAGAWVGSAIFGTWGAVFGAIACTAVAAYVSTNTDLLSNVAGAKSHVTDPASKPTEIKQEVKHEIPSVKLDIDKLLSIIANLCKSVDDVIGTFRTQVNKVVQKYESQEKASLEKEFSTILSSIQSTVGYVRAHKDDEKFVAKVVERVEELGESIENYNLSFVDFDGNNSDWFDMIPSDKAKESRQVYPAVAKNGNLVCKGKVFVAQNNE